jgi:hypothetical protein
MAEVTLPELAKELQEKKDKVTATTVQMIDHVLEHGVLLDSQNRLTDKGLKVATLIDGMLSQIQKTLAEELNALFASQEK